MTVGIDKSTLDGIEFNWFKTVSNDILTGRFKFKPTRRIDIPKPKGGIRS